MSAKDIIAVGRLSSSAPVMAKGAWWFAVLLFPAVVSGQPWEFESPIAVSPEASEGIFHHLDASGRRHVASHHGSIVVVWEDNSEGSPAVYAAIMPVAGLDFTRVRISGRGEAFEPVVTSVGEDAFIIGWEEDGAVWTRLLRGTTPGEPLMLAEDAGQLCLETGPSGRDVYAVWSQRRQHYHHIRSGRIALARGVPLLQETRWVDDHHGGADQSHPVAVYHQGLDALLVVWEDRRFRNTVLMSAAGTPAGRFSIPMQVNELGPPRAADYGRGTGVARAAAAAHDDHVVAVWADKRHLMMIGTGPRTSGCRGRPQAAGRTTSPCPVPRGPGMTPILPWRWTARASCIWFGRPAPRQTRRPGSGTCTVGCAPALRRREPVGVGRGPVTTSAACGHRRIAAPAAAIKAFHRPENRVQSSCRSQSAAKRVQAWHDLTQTPAEYRRYRKQAVTDSGFTGRPGDRRVDRLHAGLRAARAEAIVAANAPGGARRGGP
jgi:hypothetical protein